MMGVILFLAACALLWDKLGFHTKRTVAGWFWLILGVGLVLGVLSAFITGNGLDTGPGYIGPTAGY